MQQDNKKPIRPVEVQAREPYRIWLCYDDGTEGEINLSHLAGSGVFKAWADRLFFADVRIAPGGAICWGDDIDLCSDALYLRLTGMTVEDYMPKLRSIFVDA